MEILIVAALVVVAILLFIVELFFIPGISLAGLAALVCIVYANIYAFAHLGSTGGVVTLGVSFVTAVVSLVWFMRSKTLDSLSLKKNIDGRIDNSAERSLLVGDRGISITRLAQIGQAEFDGKIVEVRSVDGFIDEKTPIVVTRIAGGAVLVSRADSELRV
jgi:membrane-bound ClpP family serine protease